MLFKSILIALIIMNSSNLYAEAPCIGSGLKKQKEGTKFSLSLDNLRPATKKYGKEIKGKWGILKVAILNDERLFKESDTELIPHLACLIDLELIIRTKKKHEDGEITDEELAEIYNMYQVQSIEYDRKTRIINSIHMANQILPSNPNGYGVAIHHDRDSDGNVYGKKTIFGIPYDGIGFSNNKNPMKLWRKPRWKEVVLQLQNKSLLHHNIKMLYLAD